MKIRQATPNDIPALGALLLQVHDVHAKGRPDLFKAGARKYSDEELKTLIADENYLVFVAELDGIVCGHAICIHEPHAKLHGWQDVDSLHIDDICVDEDVRGQGIATKLYEHVLSFARERGYYNITLNVWECNPSARAFYEALGLKAYKTGMEFVL